MKILELSPDEFGFRQYATDLVRANSGGKHEFLEPVFFPHLRDRESVHALAGNVAGLKPDLIHIQHEFGYFGSKVPGRYRFPLFVKELRRLLPRTKLVATAHSVIAPDFRYPVSGRGWQAPLRAAANILLLPLLRPLWIEGTWGRLDGVIVHSRFQLPAIAASGCPARSCIPHYVPDQYESSPERKLALLEKIPASLPIIFVFGYFTPEKGQDLIIRAMKHVSSPCLLVLAGGVRRELDRAYFENCKELIQSLGLSERISITGFLSWSELDDLSRRATLAVLPFRETSGSGSLADLISRGIPILASDLPLNLEISERVPGAMAYYRADSPEGCATEIEKLLMDPAKLGRLRIQSAAYRDRLSPARVMEKHVEFFLQVAAQES